MESKNEPIINGICCDVMNCVYNNGACCCTAGTIHVNNCFDDPGRTKCETFREV